MPLQIHTTIDDHRIAKLAALAIAMHMVEAVIPSPLPGVKPGIANIVTLYVLLKYGFSTAAWVSILRVVAGSLLLGQFLSPTFALSFAGAMLSLGALWVARWLPARYFSAVSLSILAAFAHIGGQLLVVYLWLIPQANLSYLIPIFAAAALFFGVINGVIANQLLARVGKKK